ncbi:MAG: N-acetylmuramoyl-L-alanine amidase [Candidatus Sumerlaeia bacterium]|nr:N-acetylmuramoyl-L-alanine amidase [Candidatus Sumerlaeia bacterium]
MKNLSTSPNVPFPGSAAILAAALAFGTIATTTSAQVEPTFPNEGQPKGALTGANIFINPGHGWLYNQNNNRWGTQRSLSFGVIEDHDNAGAVIQHLLPYLWNAGANVYMARERDLNTNEVIVDTLEAELEGAWSIGWHDRGAYNRDYYYAESTQSMEDAQRAWFTPDIPEAGFYAVYAWYAPPVEGPAASDARFEINHAGGTTVWTQDLNRDYRTWKYIGTHWFEAGKNHDIGSVSVPNYSAEEGTHLVADAFRFGGGMSDFVENGTTTGRPRFEDSGLYHTRYIGYDPSPDSRAFNSVRAMPLWAEWECEPWQLGSSIYLSWHSNASGAGGNARGFSSFVYSTMSWDNTATTFSGYPGGVEMARSVHDGIMKTIHADYDPSWRDIGVVGRWLGETNPESNNKMPAVVLEYGFFDNPEDAAYIVDPVFRDQVSFGTYRGVLEYFVKHVEGFDTPTVVPGKPTAPKVVLEGETSFRITWQEPEYYHSTASDAEASYHLGDRARSFTVHESSIGRGFDNGTRVDFDTEHRVTLEPGDMRFYQVRGVNAGGQSHPSETIGVRVPAADNNQHRILIVNGFHRLDRGMSLIEEPRAEYVLHQDRAPTRESYNAPLILPREMRTSLGNERAFIHKMNTFDYVIEHGRALAAAGYGFESASSQTVSAGQVNLADYDAVIWIMGKQRHGETFNTITRRLVADYLEDGGRLFVSGADFAQDLFESPAGNEFLEGTLKTRFVEDLAPAHSVSGVTGSLLDGLDGVVFGETRSVYPVDTADFIRPVGGGEAILRYHGAEGPLDHAAGVAAATDVYRTVVLGFPFESITSESHRAELMRAVMNFLLVNEVAEAVEAE